MVEAFVLHWWLEESLTQTSHDPLNSRTCCRGMPSATSPSSFSVNRKPQAPKQHHGPAPGAHLDGDGKDALPPYQIRESSAQPRRGRHAAVQSDAGLKPCSL